MESQIICTNTHLIRFLCDASLTLAQSPGHWAKMRHDLVVKMCFFPAFGELRNARVGVSPHFVDLAPAARESERASDVTWFEFQ